MADVVKVVNSGLGIITNRITGAGTEPKYVAWGDSAVSAAAVGDTDLESQVSSRVEGTSSRQETAVTNDTYQVVGELTLGAGDPKAIVEVGLFDAASSGNLFLRGTFDEINLNPGDKIEFTIKTQFADGS